MPTILRLPTAALAALLLAGCNPSEIPDLPDKVVGHCNYVNNFSQLPECRDYLGEWTEAQATQDCADWRAEVVLGSSCAKQELLGECILTNASDRFTRIALPGTDGSKCGSSERGCELFGGGVFKPAPVCGGKVDDTGGTGLPTFQPPVLTCVEPKAGEPAGQSAGGQVCTWEMISGATEPGRSFDDYASCDRVRTQRPYYAAPPAAQHADADPRLDDPAYAAELGWVKSQIEATACVCCHSTRAPKGTSNWFVESGPNFLNSFYDRGLAMGAGWIDTVGFGAFPPEQNNGFTRATPEDPSHSIFVTTDNARIVRFFEAELAARGKTRADFAGQTYGAGPLDEQRFYVPTACEAGEGVQADGTLVWRRGPARYVYVLEAATTSPGVPPNLDLPEGTKWRLDVAPSDAPVASGSVRYGELPAGVTQRFPAAGAPGALISGQQYYLYVLADIAVPNARCLFTAP